MTYAFKCKPPERFRHFKGSEPEIFAFADSKEFAERVTKPSITVIDIRTGKPISAPQPK